MIKAIIRFVLLFCSLASLCACHKLFGPQSNSLVDPAEEQFQEAETSLTKGNYGKAIHAYESFDSKYPFSVHSQQAHLDVIYAYYMSGDSGSAVASADRYIHLYPRDERLDYVYYMKAVANYSQVSGAFADYALLSPDWRDLHPLHESYDDFKQITQRFPSSPYADDARQRMIYLRNVFAQYELNVSRYYYEQKAYVAAANRASYVVKYYSQAPQLNQALHMLVDANGKLGLDASKREALLMLQANGEG